MHGPMNESRWNKPMLALCLCAGFVLAGCQMPNPYRYPTQTPAPQSPPSGQPPELPPQPESTPVPEPSAPAPAIPERKIREYQLGAASRALVTQAQTQSANGDLASASATIERALRIEPSNPLLWLELGKIRQL